MERLISMVDYVIHTYDQTEDSLDSEQKMFDYANFLKQPLSIEMFVPCDLDGNVLKEPEWWYRYCNGASPFMNWDEIRPCQEFKQAKERCLFEGFEWNIAQFCDEPMIEITDKNDNYLVYDVEDKNFQDGEEVFFLTIEDLVKYKPKLTDTALKIINL